MSGWCWGLINVGFLPPYSVKVSLGSVSNVNEAMDWLTYTYLYVRMRRNPTLYGIQYMEAEEDPNLTLRRKELIVQAAKSLDLAQMLRFDERTEYLYSTGESILFKNISSFDFLCKSCSLFC